MHAQAAPHPAYGVENVGKTGLGLEQFTELVDNHDQVGQRSRTSAFTGHSDVVFADRAEVAGVAQQPLAALELAGQRRLHPPDEVRLFGQVGDEAGHVRERF